jgi:hypothetical protein
MDDLDDLLIALFELQDRAEAVVDSIMAVQKGGKPCRATSENSGGGPGGGTPASSSARGTTRRRCSVPSKSAGKRNVVDFAIWKRKRGIRPGSCSGT